MSHPPIDWDHKDYIPAESSEGVIRLSLRERRIEICKSCEHITSLNTCGKCGCFLPIKSYFKVFKCPLDKWPTE